MSLKKRLLTALGFVGVAFIVPLVLLLLLVDSTERLYVYAIVFALIFFFSFGLVFANIMSIRKELNAALEDIKVQNAAIAFKLSNLKQSDVDNSAAFSDNNIQESAVKKSNAPLNPAEPLTISPDKKKSKTKPQKDESFDDFK